LYEEETQYANANMVFRSSQVQPALWLIGQSLVLSSSLDPHDLTIDHPTSFRRFASYHPWRIKLRKHAHL